VGDLKWVRICGTGVVFSNSIVRVRMRIPTLPSRPSTSDDFPRRVHNGNRRFNTANTYHAIGHNLGQLHPFPILINYFPLCILMFHLILGFQILPLDNTPSEFHMRFLTFRSELHVEYILTIMSKGQPNSKTRQLVLL
jgi:hypothetical protein